MRLDPVLVAIAEEAEGRNGARGDELDCQDGVDLADELVTDFNCGFGYGTTKLFLLFIVLVGLIIHLCGT